MMFLYIRPRVTYGSVSYSQALSQNDAKEKSKTQQRKAI